MEGFGGVQYLRFKNYTYVPVQTRLVDSSLLSAQEVEWLNAYHAQCRRLVAPQLEGRDPEAHAWLMRETEPISA